MSWGIVETDKGPLLLAIGRDVSARLETESRLRRQSEQQAAVAALGERALRGVGPQELSEEAAERVRTTLGVERVAVLDGPKEIAAWGAVEAAVSRVSVPIHTGDEVHGALVAASTREDAFGDEEGLFLQAVANVLAIAFSRLHLEERIRHQALHDPLTGLANRALCRDRIEHALAISERAGTAAAVLFVDLDNFKRVNDLFGHAAGDALLISLAGRMSAAVRPADTVARLGGDEFVVVCEDVDERTALALGWRVAAAVQEPAEPGATPLSASIGIAFGTTGATDPDVLIGHADAAAYRAKERGSGRVEIFDEGLRRRAADRVADRERPRGRARAARARARLPAGRVARRRRDGRPRGAAALAAPRRARDRPRRVHPGRRGVGADHPDRLVGARARVPPGRRARRRVTAPGSRSTSPPARSRSPTCSTSSPARCARPASRRHRSASS